MVFELLSRILFQASASVQVHGIKVTKLAPSVDHLPFVNDLMLFYRVTKTNVLNLKACLNKYCSLFG